MRPDYPKLYPTLSIERAREDAKQWVWCQGWSPREGAFGRPMPPLGYPGGDEYDLAGGCAAECAHANSGCKNVTRRLLRASQIEEVAQKLQALRIQRANAYSELPRHKKTGAAQRFFGGECSFGIVEIGDDLAHVQRISDGTIAVVELLDGKWVARAPHEGERIYT